MRRNVPLFAAAFFFAGAIGCGGCAEPRECGEGTVLQGNLCVPVALACGEGTDFINGQCVPSSDIRCGEGTRLDGSTCVPDGDGPAPRECAGGTVQVGEACVPVDGGAPPVVCGAGTVLVGNTCEVEASDGGACVPDCLGRVCGADGCGGACGTCDNPAQPECDEAIGLCQAVCVPQCAGKACGDDGCGGECGACADDATCSTSTFRCVPDAWACNVTYYEGSDICDCDCGAPDPDCALGLPTAGCEALELCNDMGQCVPAAPPEWTCSPQYYGGNDFCDCGCGAEDPDCAFIDVFGLRGCSEGVTECIDGTCGVCSPNCTDRMCGEDGCGGTCGSCDALNDEVCADGACVDRCGPTPALCLNNECGDDGCGGACGTCASGSTCTGGICETDLVNVSPFSCQNRCGSSAPSGCYCTDDCVEFGNCCSDFADHCTCVPDCTDKVCGSDGCGGACGECDAATPYCTDDNQCTDACTPTCGNRTCGDDGCGGSCGTCGDDETCYWTYQCVPEAWTCDGVLFSDTQGCDCGCGAIDPDCDVEGSATFGCPVQRRVCADDGYCDIDVCHGNDDCAPAWCTGGYLEDAFRVGGFCAQPIAAGAPPGTACEINEECASLLCAGGQCRLHCDMDIDCTAGSACAGLPVKDPGTQVIQGYAGVCAFVPGTRAPCAEQATCGAEERCIALLDPVDEGPRYVCSSLLELDAWGQPCDFNACPAGYLCEDAAAGAVCTLPCPGGNADCPTDYTCDDRPFAPLLNSGATVPVCLPE